MVTAYRVYKGSIGKAGNSTAFHQEWHLLRLRGHLKPDPRKTFIKDLITEVKRWQSEGAQVILGGDFSENLGETSDGLANLVSTCGLTDIHAQFHGIEGEPATYVRGQKRVDYVFAMAGVLPFVRACGIEAFFTTVHSDHRGLFLDLDLLGLLGGEMAQLHPPALQGISSNSPHSEKYINALHKYLVDHNVLARSETVFGALETSVIPVCPKLLVATNRIDQDITSAMLFAKKEMPSARQTSLVRTSRQTSLVRTSSFSQQSCPFLAVVHLRPAHKD